MGSVLGLVLELASALERKLALEMESELEMVSEMAQQQRFGKIEVERVSRVPGEAWQLLDGEDSLQRLAPGGHEIDSLAAVESAQQQLGQEEETWILKLG